MAFEIWFFRLIKICNIGVYEMYLIFFFAMVDYFNFVIWVLQQWDIVTYLLRHNRILRSLNGFKICLNCVQLYFFPSQHFRVNFALLIINALICMYLLMFEIITANVGKTRCFIVSRKVSIALYLRLEITFRKSKMN